MELKYNNRNNIARKLPNNWRSIPLSDFGTWKGGGTPSMHNDDFWTNGTICWISSGDVKSTIIYDTPNKITKKAIIESSTTLLPIGSILIVTRSGILRRFLPVSYNTVPIAINQDIKAIIPNENNSAGFLLQSLIKNGNRILSRCLKSGTTVESVETKWLKEFRIEAPSSIVEQETIAEALSDVDALIESLEKLIEKKRLIKQGAMQELITGKRRLPGFETNPGYKQTEIGRIPEDWNVVPIGDMMSFKNGLNKAKRFFGQGTPIINYMDVYSHSGIKRKDIQGKVVVSFEEQRNYSGKYGDVFFTRTSETIEEIGLASVLLEEIEGVVFSGFLLRGRLKNNITSSIYRKYCFNSEIVRKQIISSGSYTTRALTNGRLLSKVLVPIPSSIDEQESISEILNDMEEELATLEVKLTKTRQIKRGMMHELLTGRIRLI